MNTESVENEPKNCWEFMKCPKEIREKCETYKLDSGDDCWFLSDLDNGCLYFKEKGGCINCPWFKLKNPKL